MLHSAQSARFIRASATCLGLIFLAAPASAAVSIDLANPSFEAPSSLPSGGVFPEADGWTETGPIDGEPPEFPGFDVPDGGPFTLDTGVFFNAPVTTNPTPPPDFISNPAFVTNADGDQLAYLFARDDGDISFQQQLETTYAEGLYYRLTVGVGKSFFLPPLNPDGPTPTVEIRLTYPGETGPVTLTSAAIDAEAVSNTELLDLVAESDVTAGDSPWLGQPIGVWIGPTEGTSGVWILDDVRLEAIPEPMSLAGLALGFAACTIRRRKPSGSAAAQ